MEESEEALRFGIVDCNNICYRMRYNMPNLHLGKKDTAVAFGFLQSLLTLKYALDIDIFLFCWDSKRSIRKLIYPKYKSKRKANKTEEDLENDKAFFKVMEELRIEILPALGFRNVFMKTGYEADDLMLRSAWDSAWDIDDRFIFITEDFDLYQVLQNNKDVYHPRKEELVTWESFYKKYGIFPSNWVDVKCIAGCTSDTIDGVQKGLGEKTAIAYLKKDASAKRTALINNKKSIKIIEFNKQIVRLPLIGCPNIKLQRDVFNVKQFKKVCAKYGFNQFRNRINEWKEVFCEKEQIESRYL